MKKISSGSILSSQGKVKEAYKVPLKFKFKVGAAATAGKVAAVAFGGVGGFFKKGADTTDEPISLVRQENGTVVARGTQHLLLSTRRSRKSPGRPNTTRQVSTAGNLSL